MKFTKQNHSSDLPGEQSEVHVPDFIENPDRVDAILIRCLLVVIAYGFILMPFRGYLLNHPWVGAVAGGSMESMITSGAHASQHGSPWIWPLILGTVGLIKFFPLYLLMGAKWGDEGVAIMLGNREKWISRVKRWEHHMVKWALPLLLFIALPFNPIPISLAAIVLGNGGLSLRRFMVYVTIVAVTLQSSLIYLGYRYGHQVMHIINTVNQYMLYVTIGLVAWAIFSVWRNRG